MEFFGSKSASLFTKKIKCRWSNLLLLATLALLTNNNLNNVNADEASNDWYSKYPVYPNYCSTPGEMKSRKIPALENDPRRGETRLVHVTSIIRHGARTIYGDAQQIQCWDGYWDSVETGAWDCALTTILAPPSPEEVVHEEGKENLIKSVDEMFLFDMRYDALQDLENGYTNALNGTCKLSQLLLQGYEQELANGRFLRDAYLYEQGTYNHPITMRLFDFTASGKNPWHKQNLYLRSDDQQQTLLSGQVLLRGLFGPEIEAKRQYKSFPTIPVHTADHHRDIMAGQEFRCPKLASLREKAYHSKEYKKFDQSQEANEVRHFINSQLNATKHEGLSDCLMTTVCTDRPLPEALDIYNPQPQSWFNRITRFHARNNSFHYLYDNGAYSQLTIAPLWAEIMDHIEPVINYDSDNDEHSRTPAKLAIYSGYDNTIMALLASLGHKLWNAEEWAPYASMVLIEIHELVDGADKKLYKSNFAFRLLYNGEILTTKIDGCPPDAELCDTSVLIARVQSFATRSADCSPLPTDELYIVWDKTKWLLHETMGILLFVFVILLSASCGGVVVFVYLTGSLPTREDFENQANSRSEIDHDDEARQGLTEEIEMLDLDDQSPFDENK